MSVIDEIAAERKRQVEGEGFASTHDDRHRNDEMVKAAVCYALGMTYEFGNWGASLWPRSWDLRWWKPTTRRRDLIKAGALIVAEIERLDRLASERGKG